MKTYFNSIYLKFLDKFSSNFQDWIKISVQVSIVLIVFFILHRGLLWLTTLPIEAYYNEFIYL